MSDKIENNVKVNATVRLEVNIHLTQPWDGEETMARVHKRAASQAHEIISQVISSYRGGSANIEIGRNTKVQMIKVEKE